MCLSRDDFVQYIAAFNRRDYAVQHSFYDDDIVLSIPERDTAPMTSKQQILDHYIELHANAEEILEPLEILAQDDRIFMETLAWFNYKQIPNDGRGGVHGFKVQPGDVLRIQMWMIYEVVNDKFRLIRCNPYGKSFVGQKRLTDLVGTSGKFQFDVFKGTPYQWSTKDNEKS